MIKRFVFYLIATTLIFFSSALIAEDIKIASNSWEEVQNTGKGEIVIYYRNTVPFIVIKEDGSLSGIEYDLIMNFQKFMKANYGYEITIKWVRLGSFSEIYNFIKNSSQSGIFGLSSISITKERQGEVLFTEPYMHDISVLISSENIALVNDYEEYNEIFDGLSAITILGTTYEKQLTLIREEFSANFPIIYVENSDNILTTISNNDNFFGYIDLSSYLLALDNHRNINRQNIFTMKNMGFAITHPLNSDWSDPLEVYFSNPRFNDFLKSITEKYLSGEIYELMETIANSDHESLILLSREIGIQDKEISRNEAILKEQRTYRNLIIFCLFASIIVLIMLYNRYKVKVKANEILSFHKKKIQKQKQDIKLQNKELEIRNFELISLNEEKNNLIKILSHDLRAPANNIQGLTSIYFMDNKDMNEGQKKIMNHIKGEAVRLNLMIEKILDIRSIESKKANINFEKVNFVEIIKSVSDSFSKTALLKNIVLNFVSDESIIYINADEIYLKQIIENLISNALKFSNQGTLVTILVIKEYNRVKLEVQDQGPGITEEDRGKMFNKFQRLTAKPTGGENSTGLGLSIVKKFAEEMHGTIICEPNRKVGCNFILEFDIYNEKLHQG